MTPEELRPRSDQEGAAANPACTPIVADATSPGKTAAFAYSARGWPVLPLHSIRDGCCTCGKADCKSPGKHPRVAGGVADATTDPVVIERWWTRWPDANVAIATGAPSGLLVLDIDPRNGGGKTIVALQRENGVIPPTFEAATGGGGVHVLFQHPRRRTIGKLGEGVEVKSDGGYVVAAPSIHASGQRYRWQTGRAPGEVDLADLPERWLRMVLRETLAASPKPTASSSFSRGDGAAVPLGLVNHCLAALKLSRCDEYDDWIHVALILKRTPTDPPSDPFVLWCNWSRQSAKYQGEADCFAYWQRCYGECNSPHGPSTIGSLVAWAREDSGDSTIGRGRAARVVEAGKGIILRIVRRYRRNAVRS